MLFLSFFTVIFGLIVIHAYYQRGNLYYFGLIIFIIAYLLILLPFFNIYLPLYGDAPWGNTIQAETFYLGCFLLICGGFLLLYDVFIQGKRIILDYRKLPEKTKQSIMNGFLFVSGLFFVFNLWDYNGLIMPIYFNYQYAPEPLLLEKVPVMIQFTINSTLIGIWLFIFIFFLYKRNVLKTFRVKVSIILIFVFVSFSIFLILNCKNLGINYNLLKYWISPLPSFLIVIPLLIILKSDNIS